MYCKDKKEFSPIIMGLCPKPRDLTLYGQKHDGNRAAQEVLPHVFVINPALGLLPSRALSSELINSGYQDNYKLQDIAIWIVKGWNNV